MILPAGARLRVERNSPAAIPSRISIAISPAVSQVARRARNRQVHRMSHSALLEVFGAFLKLGSTSFGGPIAHLGYFRNELISRRRWLQESAYAELLALCQVLPGPTSSQVAFCLGLARAGYPGGVVAWIGFTLPSAILLTALAYGSRLLGGSVGAGVVHGLKLVAVAIVAQAVWGMARTLCPDRRRASIACVGAFIVLVSQSSLSQFATIVVGGIAGLVLCRSTASTGAHFVGIAVSRGMGIAALGLFVSILIALPFLGQISAAAEVFSAFYRSGALVFGGGHVVLPLLRSAFVETGWVNEDQFISGYAAAQGIPGPLFSFAAYLGAIVEGPARGLAGAALGLCGIFLPGMLIVVGALPFWNSLRAGRRAQAALQGVNAVVVGLLAAALYDPLWTSSVKSAPDFGVALAAFALLVAWRTQPLVVVVLGGLAGVLLNV